MISRACSHCGQDFEVETASSPLPQHNSGTFTECTGGGSIGVDSNSLFQRDPETEETLMRFSVL